MGTGWEGVETRPRHSTSGRPELVTVGCAAGTRRVSDAVIDGLK